MRLALAPEHKVLIFLFCSSLGRDEEILWLNYTYVTVNMKHCSTI
jgi:hypothetical protein